MSSRNFILLLLASVGLSWLAACDLLDMGTSDDASVSDDCGLEECDHELTVEIIRSDNDVFEVGSYNFGLVAPDGSQFFVECYLLHPEFGMDCQYGDIDVIVVTTDASATTVFMDILGAPEYVLATVEFNGYVIGERTLYPEYEVLTPNGEECPPVCYVGDDFMAVNPW